MIDIIYIAAYLSLGRDYHRDRQEISDNFEYIKEYYDSIKRNGLRSMILVDGCTQSFIDKYSIKIDVYEIKLIKLNKRFNNISIQNIHIHDERFYYFYDIVVLGTNDYYVLSDISEYQ